jgi:type IV pilus assembly protein PilM
MNKSDVLCIDWDERSLRILDTSLLRSGPQVRRAVHVTVPAGMDVRDPSAMGDFLRRTLGEHRIRTRRAIVDVPRQETVLNRLSLPTGSMDEMAAMVHLQIAKELPFSKDQAVIDFAVVPRQGSPTADVWVAAIRINVVEYYRQVFAAAGLTLDRIGLRPYANVRALQAIDASQGRVVMVDIGPSMTEINILLDGQLMYTRAASVSVPVGLVPPSAGHGDGDGRDEAAATPLSLAAATTGEAWSMDTLLIEVSRTIAAYRASDLGASIDRMVLAGTAAADEQLVAAFRDRFGIEATVYTIPRNVRWKPEKSESVGPFSAAIGLALSTLGEPSQCFDFLHVKEPEAEHRQRVKRRPVVAATVVMFLAAGVVAAYQPIRSRNVEIAGIKATISNLNQDQKTRQDALKKLKDLKAWQAGNVVWMDYVKKLAAVFPSNKDCYITRLEITAPKGVITLNLAAANRFVAAKVVDAVEAVREGKNPVFDAKPGNKASASKDPEYPVSDEVTITVLPLAPKAPAKKK